MKNKIFQIIYITFIGFVIFLAGVRYGQKKTYKLYAEKFPEVENFQVKPRPLLYGNIMLIGTEANPCDELPCVNMWNGKTWVKLVPE